VTTEERLNLAVDRTLFAVRRWWLLHAAVVGGIMGYLLSGWWLLAIPVYLSLSYQLVMLVVEKELVKALQQDLADIHRAEAMLVAQQLKEKLVRGEIEQDESFYETLEKYDLNIAKVERFSEEKVGRFGDAVMHEWVEMHDMTTRKVERFYFEQVAPRAPDGTPVIPHIAGKLSAVVDGIVYSRQVQPA
jgi:uncharacterized membrane protein